MDRELIEAAKERHGVSNAGLARLLGCHRNLITEAIKGRTHLGTATLGYLAELAGENPEKIIAKSMADKAKTTPVKKYWAEKVRRLQALGAVVAIAVGLSGLAAGGVNQPGYIAHNVYYVKYKQNQLS